MPPASRACGIRTSRLVDLGDVAPLELGVSRWGNGDVHVAVLDGAAPEVQGLEYDGG